MKDLNTVTLIGRVTKDGSIGYMQSGSAKLDFSVAFTTTKKNGNEWVNESNFINLTLWGKQAESLNPYIKKGQQVAISGHLKQEVWEKEGKKNYMLKVICDDVQLLGGRKESGNESPEPAPANSGSNSDFPEDVPF